MQIMNAFCGLATFCAILLLQCLNLSNATSYLESNYPASVTEDAHLDTVQLLRKYNYPAETHYVTTLDKYILCMHRIAKPGGRPILLMHGLLDSSAGWILMGPWSSLGYLLHDHGYDVWLGNARGNRYSRNHTTLNPDKDSEFWSFSWHEIGMFDLSAMIDYVLEITDHKRLSYVGHSQGTTSFWVLCSMQPVYNSKISMMNGFSPVAFVKNFKSAFKRPLSNFISLSKTIMREFLPHSNLLLQNCFRSALAEEACVEVLWQLMGRDEKQLNRTMLPTIAGHIPAGCSSKQVQHYLQLVESDRFCHFDYGPNENKQRYNLESPPDYPLNKVTVPVGLHYTRNDYMSTEVDVKRLARTLPNVLVDKLYAYKNWNHLTLMWGIDAREQVYLPMLEKLSKYE